MSTSTNTTTYYDAGHIHYPHIPCGSVRVGAAVTAIEGPATEAELVAIYGARCCTHCFPTAATIAAERAAAESAANCPGAGTWLWDDVNQSSRLARSPKGRCRHCGEMVRLSSTNRLHKH